MTKQDVSGETSFTQTYRGKLQGQIDMILQISIFVGVVMLSLLAYAILQHFQTRRDLRNRLKQKSSGSGKRQTGDKAGADGTLKSVGARVANQAANYYETSDPAGIKTLRLMLIRAGYFDPKAIGWYFAIRVLLAVGGLVGAMAVLRTEFFEPTLSNQAMVCIGMTMFGYYLPRAFLDNRIRKVTDRNRIGFPDFMDLMVVCAEAGLSIEAALDRVGREIGESYPELSTHLSIASLEIRAGNPMEDALKTLADRLGLAEVKSFATLLQQSKELGTSLSEALKVYSDEMKHKRLSAAEEKAYALPAKMSVPVTGFILPVVLLVAILPAIVRFMGSGL